MSGPLVLFIDDLDRYNAGVDAAVHANRRRDERESFLEAMSEAIERWDP